MDIDDLFKDLFGVGTLPTMVVDYCFLDEDGDHHTVRDVEWNLRNAESNWMFGTHKDGRAVIIPVHRILWVKETEASAKARAADKEASDA